MSHWITLIVTSILCHAVIGTGSSYIPSTSSETENKYYSDSSKLQGSLPTESTIIQNAASPPSTKLLSKEKMLLCIQSCPMTVEYRPVCGTNNVTYLNLGRLICEKKCGIKVDLRKRSECEQEIITTEKVLTKEEQIAICMRACTVTGEYNPVCGSDNITYTNPGRLECAQNCGADVQLKRRTSCFAPLTNEEKDGTTSSTQLPDIITTTSLPFINGNADFTISVNSSLENKKTSNNDYKEMFYDEIYGNNKNQSTVITVNNTNGISIIANFSNNYSNDNETNSPNVNFCNKEMSENFNMTKCMQLCKLTYEYNPVCGNNGVTYTNPGRLLCAQYCGIDVKLIYFEACSPQTATINPCGSQTSSEETPTFTNPPVIVTTLSPTQACMEACPASPLYKPVCGSNNVTYRNREVLQCARRCEIDVSFVSDSECSHKPDKVLSPAEKLHNCIQWCSESFQSEAFDPICGSDNVTYNNTAHMVCAKQCGIDVYVKSLSPCTKDDSNRSIDYIATTNPPSEDEQVTPGYGGLDFVIPQYILDRIWPEETTTTEEDHELDQRTKNR